MNQKAKPAQMPRSHQIFWVTLLVLALGTDFLLPRYWQSPKEPGLFAALYFAATNLLYPVMIFSFADNDRYQKPVYDMRWLTYTMLAIYLGMIAFHFFG